MASVAAVVVSCALAGCGLGTKQALANLIIHSAPKALATGSAEGSVTVEVRITHTAFPVPQSALPSFQVSNVPAELDFTHDRAALGVGPGRPLGPAAELWAGNTVVFQRSASAGGRTSATASSALLGGFGGSGGSGGAGGGGNGSVTSQVMLLFFGAGPPGIMSLQRVAGSPGSPAGPGAAAGTPGSISAAKGAGVPSPAGAAASLPASSAAATGSRGPATTVSVPTTTAAASMAGATGLLAAASASISSGASANGSGTSRQWFRYDFSTRKVRDTVRTVGAMSINPDFLVQLLAGTLSGSPVLLGQQELDGVTTTHYAMTVDPTKADRNFSGTQQDDITKLFDANGIFLGSTVYPAQVWLGPDGLPRRIQVTFHQIVAPANQDDLIITLDLSSYGTQVAVPLPDSSDVADVQGLSQLVQAVSG
ncbi:MAG TPA: hypothetical protein VE990_01305 [Acidimicrobiales bacterium]|nr:hypothetical protein [Acidimicrobiales bacterium]